jgi:DNA-binding transcriptional MerR regulator
MVDTIPNKRFFRIGEVSRIIAVPAHVLRYWEREFPFLHPWRAASKQRLYRRSDVETLLNIKNLLYHEKYTIAGAREKLRARRDTRTDSPSACGSLEEVREELIALRRLLD